MVGLNERDSMDVPIPMESDAYIMNPAVIRDVDLVVPGEYRRYPTRHDERNWSGSARTSPLTIGCGHWRTACSQQLWRRRPVDPPCIYSSTDRQNHHRVEYRNDWCSGYVERRWEYPWSRINDDLMAQNRSVVKGRWKTKILVWSSLWLTHLVRSQLAIDC